MATLDIQGKLLDVSIRRIADGERTYCVANLFLETKDGVLEDVLLDLNNRREKDSVRGICAAVREGELTAETIIAVRKNKNGYPELFLADKKSPIGADKELFDWDFKEMQRAVEKLHWIGSVARLKFLGVNGNNITIAREIQNSITDGMEGDAYVDYLESVAGITKDRYWILSVDGDFIGVCGLQISIDEPNSAWPRWFGILNQWREKGFGKKALQMFEQEALSAGCKYARICLRKYEDTDAVAFFESQGYSGEPWEYVLPGLDTYAIYSKNLKDTGEIVPSWGDNRPLP